MRHARRARAARGREREQIVNLDHALREMAIVRQELAALPEGLTKHQREVKLLEPMSRLAMVVRFLDEILNRNGWARRSVPA